MDGVNINDFIGDLNTIKYSYNAIKVVISSNPAVHLNLDSFLISLPAVGLSVASEKRWEFSSVTCALIAL